MTFLMIEIISYVIFCIVVITLGIIVNAKLYRNVKNEEHLEKGKIVQKIMKDYCLAQCITWPILIVTAFTLKINKDVFDIIPRKIVSHIIIVIRFLNTFNSCYGGYNSLVIAICRWACIVHESAVEKFGVKMLRKVLITSSFGVPILYSVLNDSLMPVEQVWSAFFMPNQTTLMNETTFREPDPNKFILDSPLYLVTEAYLPRVFKYGLKLVWFVILTSVHSNVLEGILYLHTYIFYKR